MTCGRPSGPLMMWYAPTLPVIVPCASAETAQPARYPRSSGFQSANAVTVPLWTYFFIWLGRPRPVSTTSFLYFEVERYCAAEEIPTVVGDSIPFRCGYACSMLTVACRDWAGLSLP